MAFQTSFLSAGAAFMVREALGLILLVAAVAKLADRETFEQALQSYRLFSKHTVSNLAKTIPYAEACLGVLLVFGLFLNVALPGALALLTAFTV